MPGEGGRLAPHRNRPAAAILVGGVAAGALDLMAAFVVYGLRGATPLRILQSIASGLLGSGAFAGGNGTALLGCLLHFAIAHAAAAFYYLASRRMSSLIQRPARSGMLYGVGVYVFMNFLVVPLSAVPKRPLVVGVAATVLVVHMLFVGLPIALAVRRYSAPAAGGP